MVGEPSATNPMIASLLAATLLLQAAAPSPAATQEPAADERRDAVPERIAWYGTLDSALAEAQRTQRPLFLLSARPEYRSVPGFW